MASAPPSPSASDSAAPVDVAIVGAGISGLATAFWLRRDHGISPIVLEGAPSAGGLIETATESDFIFDRGPQSILAGDPDVEDLVRGLGLEATRIYAPPATRNRFIVRDGKLVPLPLGPVQFLRTPLLTAGAKARFFGEPFVPRGPRTARPGESVGSFVRRRLGPEFLDSFVGPFVSGIYAGDPDRLGVASAFPRLAALEARGGSLTVGAVRKLLGWDGPPARLPANGQPARRGLFSFRGGMAALPRALAADAGAALRTGVRVAALREPSTPEGPFGLELAGGAELAARNVVLAGRADESVELLGDAVAPLATIPYAPVAVVALAYRRQDVAHALDGFGFLARADAGLAVLGCLFSTTLWADRAPAGHVILTCYVGGVRAPQRATADEADLIAWVREDLAATLGVAGEPVRAHVRRIRLAIAQYEPEHAARIASAAALERARPGLFLTGAWRDGVGVRDRIGRSRELAARVASTTRR